MHFYFSFFCNNAQHSPDALSGITHVSLRACSVSIGYWYETSQVSQANVDKDVFCRLLSSFS